jgi:hypothetical protein
MKLANQWRASRRDESCSGLTASKTAEDLMAKGTAWASKRRRRRSCSKPGAAEEQARSIGARRP